MNTQAYIQQTQNSYVNPISILLQYRPFSTIGSSVSSTPIHDRPLLNRVFIDYNMIEYTKC